MDSLVRIYDKNINDLRIIFSNTESIKDMRKEKKETKNLKNDKIKTQSYVLTGKTLMEKHNIKPQFMKDKFPEFLQYLYLIPNSSQPYDIYRNVGFSIRASGGSEEDFRNWASLSKKYLSQTSGKFIKNFNNFLIGKQCLTINYLKNLAKESHPEYFDQSIELLNDYFNPNYDGIRTITEDKQYLSSLDENIKEKVIVLKSQLGGGKTTSIKNFIKVNDFKRILIVSPRITFSKFISTEFDTQFYLDEDVKINGNKLTISIESLHKIEFNTPYDVIIMDESEANLSVFSSLTTIRENQVKCFEVLNHFIKKSKHVILASAFITKKTVDFAKSLDDLKSIVFINNIRKPILKHAYRFHQDVLTMKLIESIQLGEKNYVCFSTKKQLNLVNDIIRGLGLYKTKNILIYSSDMDDSQIETLENIHE